MKSKVKYEDLKQNISFILIESKDIKIIIINKKECTPASINTLTHTNKNLGR